MPMVAETSQSPSRRVRLVRDGTVTYGNVSDGKTRSQVGYRSVGRDPLRDHALSEDFTWGEVANAISTYDEIYEYDTGSHSPRYFLVNPRDYSETTYRPGFTTSGYTMGPLYPGWPPVKSWAEGVLSITDVATNIPSRPTASAMQGIAGSLLRRTAPTRAEIDLTRSLGELKDFHLMLRASAYNPRSLKQAGGTFLNAVFGIEPTLSDLQRVAETVVSADSILAEYIRQERRKLRRSATHTYYDFNDSGVISGVFSGFQSPTLATCAFGPITAKAARVLPTTEYSRNDVMLCDVAWSLHASQTLTGFATYEYFIPKPTGIEERLGRYKQMASRLAGGGLTLPVIWELTPWTWLTDWFVDVGGLLRYQQTVVDNQLVASRQGYTLRESTVAAVHFSGHHLDYSRVVNPYTFTSSRFSGGASTFRKQYVYRRPGNPFGLSPTWTLSKQQWAIVAAMGLSRSEGVPLIGS